MGGGGGGSHNWVGINFCHPEVVKLQQQCYMQNAIFGLPPNGSIGFFLGESANISRRQQQENWKEK